MQLDETTLKQIAEELESGFCVYLHRENGELIALPDENQFVDIDIDLFKDEIKRVKKERKQFYVFEPMDSRASFRVMESFIGQVSDTAVQARLEDALQKKRPFAHFKNEVDNAGDWREQWFTFRLQQFMDLAKSQFEQQFKKAR